LGQEATKQRRREATKERGAVALRDLIVDRFIAAFTLNTRLAIPFALPCGPRLDDR